MNSNQKIIIIICLVLILLLFVMWFATGAEVFTKTQVWVDTTTDLDKMLGVQTGEWQDKFIFGLLPGSKSIDVEFISVTSLGGIIILISGILFFLFKSKKM